MITPPFIVPLYSLHSLYRSLYHSPYRCLYSLLFLSVIWGGEWSDVYAKSSRIDSSASSAPASQSSSSQSSSSPSSSSESTRFALFIGANLGLADEPLLRFAEKDALHVSKVFSHFGQVPPQNQIVLLSPEINEIKQSFQVLKRRIQGLSSPDQATLILYYSGHADANALHIGPDRLTFDVLKKYLKQTQAPLKLVLIDACRSGAFTRLKGAKSVPAFKIKTEPLIVKGVAVISSASPHEDAQESDVIQGGIFTQHLVTGLMGAADRSQDQRISLTEIYEYTYKETVKSTSQTATIQHPNYAFTLRGKQDFILTKLKQNRGFPRLQLSPPTSSKPDPNGIYLFIPIASDHPLTEVRVDEVQDLLVHPGDYLVRYRDRSGLYEKRLTFKPNQSYTLKGRTFPQIPYGESVRRGRDALSLSASTSRAWALSLDSSVFTPLMTDMSLRGGGGLQLERQFPSFSLHFRLGSQWSQSQFKSPTMGSPSHFTQLEVSSEVGIGHFFDLSWASILTQIWVGGAWLNQQFPQASNAKNRSSWSGVIAPNLGLHFSLGPRFFTRLMGGARLWFVSKVGGLDEQIGWQGTWLIGSYL